MDALKIYTLIVVIITMFIYVPLSCNGIYQYTKYYNNITMTKRYSNITLISCILLVIIMVVGSISVFSHVGFFAYTIGYWFLHITFILLLSQMYLFIVRIFLNYYDIQYAKAINNNQWKQLINISSSTSDWYIKNKMVYGSLKYWIKYIIILIIITCIIIYLPEILYPNDIEHDSRSRYQNIAALIIGTIGTWFIIIIRYKVWKLKFDDKIYFGREIQLCLIAGVISMFFNVFIVFIFMFFPNHELYDRVSFAFVFFTLFYFWIFIFTNWVINKTNLNSFSLNNSMFRSEQQIVLFSKMTSVSVDDDDNNHHVNPKNVNTLKLKNVLKDIDGFQLLINHILKEFSIEIFISQIEMYQYQKLLIKHINNDNNEEFGKYFSRIEYPKEIVPESDIVYNDIDQKYINMINNDNNNNKLISSLKIRAWLLHQKYVKQNSEFEVNISYGKRRELTTKMDDFDQWINNTNDNDDNPDTVNEQLIDLLKLFKGVMDEQYALLRYSWGRFKTTTSYNELANKLST